MELNEIGENGKPSSEEKAVAALKKSTVDPIQKLIGNFGKYQLWLCLFVFSSKFPIAFHQMAIIFLAPKVSYTCPDTNKQTCPCDNPVYDKTLFEDSIIMEWHLICERKWMASLAQTFFQLGTLVGSLAFGMASDKYGRKIPMLMAIVIQVTIGVISAYIKNYWMFTLLRFIIGVSVGGTMVIGFVIIMEFVGTKYRDVVSACYQIPFVLGHMLLPGFAYFFRNFQDFQLAISVPSILLMSYICLLPETPRWLIAAKRTDDAIKILERVADVYGRKIPMLMAIVIQVTIGVISAYIKNYWMFTLLRFIIGVSVGGTMVIGFVIIMEFVGTKYRDVVSACYQIPFVLGHMLLPGFAYFFRNFQDFQLAISVPSILLMSYICLLPETPRWLIAAKRTDDAIKILERVADVNKLPKENIRPEVEAYLVALEKNHLQKGNILDLFRTPNLRKNIICMAINWLSCSYCFYGVSQYVGQLGGNVFVNVACSAAVTLCGTLLSIALVRLVGRKTLVIIFNFLSVVCLIILAIVSEGIFSVILACIGVVSSFIVFVVVYLYCTELFPTVVRNAALGFSSMMARVGSMIAPFVITLRDQALWVPPVLFAALPLVAGFVITLLPETRGCELTTTIEEGERFGKQDKSKDVITQNDAGINMK